MKLKIKFIKFWRKLKTRYNRLSVKQRNFLGVLAFIGEYGILINIILYGVFRWEYAFLPETIIGFGVLYYFISYEPRALWNSWREGRE